MVTPAAGEEFRVLVIDDNHDAATTMALLLQAWGYSARYVVDSRKAVALAEEFRPHCVICDLRMPMVNGYELAQEFRQHPLFQRIPLIANSATPDDRRALAAGFDYSLVKPHSILVIGDLLREFRVMNERLKKAEEANQKGTEVVTEVRDLVKEVRDDVREIKVDLRNDVDQLKTDLREVKEDVKELREERGGGGKSDSRSE